MPEGGEGEEAFATFFTSSDGRGARSDAPYLFAMDGSLKITVMLGGPSAEREVSLRSGEQVASALRSRGHEVKELDPREENWELPEGTDLVFLALHGTYGEDGT